jgi:hypothetical protein
MKFVEVFLYRKLNNYVIREGKFPLCDCLSEVFIEECYCTEISLTVQICSTEFQNYRVNNSDYTAVVEEVDKAWGLTSSSKCSART